VPGGTRNNAITLRHMGPAAELRAPCASARVPPMRLNLRCTKLPEKYDRGEKSTCCERQTELGINPKLRTTQPETKLKLCAADRSPANNTSPPISTRIVPLTAREHPTCIRTCTARRTTHTQLSNKLLARLPHVASAQIKTRSNYDQDRKKKP
jgi:hypothetical protein